MTAPSIHTELSAGVWEVNNADSSDDAPLIQSVINSVQNNGSGVCVLNGLYRIQNPLIVSADNIHLAGMGHGTIIQALPGFPSGMPMIWVQGPGGTTPRRGFGMSD